MEKPATPTPLSDDELARELVAGYTSHFGTPPDRETAELLLALVDIENAHGQAIIQHNWGNISTHASDAVDYWRPPWFDLDKVNAMPDDSGPSTGFGAETAANKKERYLRLHAAMVAGKVPSAFLAFPDHETGARVFLSNVKPSMYDAATTGDPMAFAQAYFESGYCPDQACKDSGPTFKSLQGTIRSKGYFSALAPSKKKVAQPLLPNPVPPPEEHRPLSQSPPPVSPSGSSSPLSASAAAGGSPDNLRNLVVFAASCELEDMNLLVSLENTAGIAERIAVYWADVLHQAPSAPHPPQWCGAFALWCLHQAGLGLLLRWLFGPPNYGFLWNLEKTHAPKPGDIAYLDKPFEHHAIVVEVVGDTVHTIDGNQGPHAPIMTHEAPLSHWTAFFSIESLIAEALK
ncbi:MAG TPA: CHAP domain-containing protein [Verrucomicrobiae bacterium]|nr:CHAP domain-containing protein [Verrucomicrobiae bacterium]